MIYPTPLRPGDRVALVGPSGPVPPERVEPEMRNKRILDEVRTKTLRPLVDGLKDIDQELVKGAVAGERFQELFFASCKDQAIADYVKSLL